MPLLLAVICSRIAITLDPTFTINRTVAAELTVERTLISLLARRL